MKIRGNVVGTPMKRPDFEQKDPKKSDFIKNNPIPDITEEDEGKIPKVVGGKYELTDEYQTKEDEALNTIDKKIVNAINEVISMVGGDSWKLNDKFDAAFTREFDFVSNGKNFVKMEYLNNGTFYVLRYIDATGDFETVYTASATMGWREEYQTIFTEDIDETLLDGIATKIQTGGVPEALSTQSKTLVGAINELRTKGVKFIPAYYNEEDEEWYEDPEFLQKVVLTALGRPEEYVLFQVPLNKFDPIRIFSPEIKIFESVDSAVEFIVQLQDSIWDRLPEEAKAKIKALCEEVIGWLKDAVNTIVEWFGDAGEDLTEFSKVANAKIKELAKEMFNNLIQGLQNAVNAILGWFGDVGEAFDKIPEAAKTKIKNVITDIFNDFIVEPVDSFWQWIVDQVTKLAKEIAELPSKVWDETTKRINEAKENLQEKIDEAGDALNELKEDVTTHVKTKLAETGEKLEELGEDIENNVKTKLKEAQDWIDDTGKGIKQWIDDKGNQITYKLDEIVEFLGGDLVPDSNFEQITNDKFTTFAKTTSIDTLDTNYTTVVGAINELNKILKGYTWNLWVTQGDNEWTENLYFVSSSQQFNQMRYVRTSTNCYTLIYRRTDGSEVEVYRKVNGVNEWIFPQFNTIYTYQTGTNLIRYATLTKKSIVSVIDGLDSEIDSEISAMTQALEEGRILVGCALEAQSLRDEGELTTNSPTVIGAINELDKQALHTLGYIDTHYDNPKAIKETASGITWMDKYELDAGITQVGDIYHKVPIVAGNNVTFEVDETNKVVKINSTGGGDIDTSNLATVDKIGTLDAWYGEVSQLNARTSGITWDDDCAFLGGDDEELCVASISQRVPIVAGENINFEVDGNVVKINATGGGGSENTILSVTVETDYPTTMSAIIEAIQAVGGDLPKLTFVTLTGYMNRNLMMSFWWRGGNCYTVVCVDADSMEKIYNPATNNSVNDVTSLRIADFLYDGTPKEEMPQIRFVGIVGNSFFGHVNWEEIDDTQDRTLENLRFTIEIVSGSLKVGDAIQICRMCNYGGTASYGANGVKKPHPPKRKLRRYVEHIVTEDDLNKRFVAFDVAWDDEKAIRLFFKTTQFVSNLSPIYFRVRRPKGEINSGSNGGGMTVDAEFSNVVTVWRTSQEWSWYDGSIEKDVNFYKLNLL